VAALTLTDVKRWQIDSNKWQELFYSTASAKRRLTVKCYINVTNTSWQCKTTWRCSTSYDAIKLTFSFFIHSFSLTDSGHWIGNILHCTLFYGPERIGRVIGWPSESGVGGRDRELNHRRYCESYALTTRLPPRRQTDMNRRRPFTWCASSIVTYTVVTRRSQSEDAWAYKAEWRRG
jgi:hypothetical protein